MLMILLTVAIIFVKAKLNGGSVGSSGGKVKNSSSGKMLFLVFRLLFSFFSFISFFSFTQNENQIVLD